MDAVEFLEEFGRMCDSYGGDCGNCEIRKETKSSLTCRAYVFAHPQGAVAIVEQWAKEHPRKTRQNELLKMFPRVEMDADGIVKFCPLSMDSDFPCPAKQNFNNYRCPECRQKYWLEPLDE